MIYEEEELNGTPVEIATVHTDLMGDLIERWRKRRKIQRTSMEIEGIGDDYVCITFTTPGYANPLFKLSGTPDYVVHRFEQFLISDK